MTEELAARIQRPHALALTTTIAGAAKYLAGQWREGLTLAEKGASMLREQCSGVTWELDTADIFVLSALVRLGRWGELPRRVEEMIRGARARGDLYALVNGHLDAGAYAWLTTDQPEELKRRLDEALGMCSQQEGVLMQHVMHHVAMANVELYCGEAEQAWARIDGGWKDLKSTFATEIPMMHMDALDLRARSAVACASLPEVPDGRRRAWLKAASRDIARMEKEHVNWVSALAALLRAGAATARGALEEARDLFTAAEAAFASVEMGVHQTVARRRYGELVGGDEGLAIVRDADQALLATGIRAPARVAAMLAPGRFHRP
jgi:sirohydrochlorin ferrochelatase